MGRVNGKLKLISPEREIFGIKLEEKVEKYKLNEEDENIKKKSNSEFLVELFARNGVTIDESTVRKWFNGASQPTSMFMKELKVTINFDVEQEILNCKKKYREEYGMESIFDKNITAEEKVSRIFDMYSLDKKYTHPTCEIAQNVLTCILGVEMQPLEIEVPVFVEDTETGLGTDDFEVYELCNEELILHCIDQYRIGEDITSLLFSEDEYNLETRKYKRLWDLTRETDVSSYKSEISILMMEIYGKMMLIR